MGMAAYPAAQPVGETAGDWQIDATFPDCQSRLDDTLAINNALGFRAEPGQGMLYLTPAEGLMRFRLLVNGRELALPPMAAGETWQVDAGPWVRSGMNLLQISGIAPRELARALRVRIPWPEVRPMAADAPAFAPRALALVSRLIDAEVRRGFPGAQLAVVHQGRLVYEHAWGWVNAYAPDGAPLPDRRPVTCRTLFDLASNTKMYAINYAMQYLITRGEASLDWRVAEVLGPAFVEETIPIAYEGWPASTLEENKAWKALLTVRDLMCHQAGFPADPRYDCIAYDQARQRFDPRARNPLCAGADGTAATREHTLAMICRTPLMYAPGTHTLYSDVDYILLTFVVEKLTGRGLEAFLRETFWRPMGLERVTFNPLQNGFSPEDCAATELRGNTRDGAVRFEGVRTHTLQGEVHDEKAACGMAGVSGHAGLFASAADLARLASVMLYGGYGRHTFFSRDVIDLFTAPKAAGSGSWGLGWFRSGDNQRPWYFGVLPPSQAVGHQGWTGTMTVIDPQRSLVVAYLTHKINTRVTDPARDMNRFDGGWYTAASLGFVTQLIQMELAGVGEAGFLAVAQDMISDKLRLAERAGAADAGHPAVQSLYALVEVFAGMCEEAGNAQARAMLAETLSWLPDGRDAAEKALLAGRSQD